MSGTSVPTVSVVIPSRNRPELLASCLARVSASIERAGVDAEIVVVDDGSEPPVTLADPRITVVRGIGEGPSRARNRGIAVARGEVVAFTDDDAEVSVDWLAAALRGIEAVPGAVGARGPVRSPSFDPLYEYSVEDLTAGRYLTCNVAYRRSELQAVGGFDPSFRYAHEDVDLGLRMAERGPVVFVDDMEVVHPGRAFSATEWDRRARFIQDDWLFFRRYPDQLRGRPRVATAPLSTVARRWARMATTKNAKVDNPRRMARWLRLSLGQTGRIAALSIKGYRQHALRPVAVRSGLRSDGLRIAYVGPVPNRKVGGAPGVAGLIIEELCAKGSSVDCYVPTSYESDATEDISSIEGVRVASAPSRFRFGKWYSKQRFSKMASSQLAAARSRQRLAGALAAEHAMAPYDVIYQFSNIESFGIPSDRRSLPPLVIHPSVHAAGELRWLRAERAMARRAEGRLRPWAVRRWVSLRAARQRRDIAKATKVLALSKAFAGHLISDYELDPARVAVVPNAIDFELFTPGLASDEPETVYVLGRVVVRKGIESIIELSQRLGDLEGTLRLVVVGDGSLWSDYRPLLADLDPRIAEASGPRPRAEIATQLPRARLLIQASRYEPFGLTVAEALACGIPVIATDEVGAAEGLDPEVCTVIPAGDVDALETALRAELARGPLSQGRRERCRAEARARYDKSVVAAAAFAELSAAAATQS